MSTDLLEVREATSTHAVEAVTDVVPETEPVRSLRSALSRAALRMQSDERLMELCQDGCEEAYETIDERYRQQLVRYCTPMLGVDRAQDVAQQTLTQAFMTLRNGERPAKLRWWLLRVAHNFSIDTLRKKSFTYEELDESFDGVPQPPALMEDRQRFGAVLEQISGLPERQRAALLLREFEGRSYEEIAEELDASPAVVSQLLQRARTSLRKAAACLIPAPLLRMFSSPGTGNSRIADLANGASASSSGLLGAGAVVAVGIVTLGAGVAVQERNDRGVSRPGQAVAVASAPASTGNAGAGNSNRDPNGKATSPAASRPRVGERPSTTKQEPSAGRHQTTSNQNKNSDARGEKASGKSTPVPVAEPRQLTAREEKQQKRAEKDANKQAAKQERNENKREKAAQKQVAAQEKRDRRQDKSARQEQQAQQKTERKQANQQAAAEKRAQQEAAREQKQAAREQARAEQQAQRDAARQQAQTQREAVAQQRKAAQAEKKAAKQDPVAPR